MVKAISERQPIRTAKAKNRFKYPLRTRFLLLTLLAIGCLAGCILQSPTKRFVKEAQAWLQVAERLKLSSHSNTAIALNEILRPVQNSELAGTFKQLARISDNFTNGKALLIGRAYLGAGVAYIAAARIALTENKLSEAKEFCLAASRNFAVATNKWLPSWERESVLRWVSLLESVTAKLDKERFYAFTHLTALLEKAKAHLKFVPPVNKRW